MKIFQALLTTLPMISIIGANQVTVTVTKTVAQVTPPYPGCFMVCQQNVTTRSMTTATPSSGSSSASSSVSTAKPSSTASPSGSSAAASSTSAVSSSSSTSPSAAPSSAASGGTLITEDEFKKAVVAAGYPSPSTAQYKALSTQATSKGSILTKRELAMFLAQILWESDGLKAKEEYACKDTGCPGQYVSPNDNGKRYFGRGYIQLTWYDNYAAASKDLYGDDRLVKNPEMVAKDEDVAWATALWYWKSRVHAQVQGGEFGKSTKAINGALECSGGATDKPKKRFEIYKKVMVAFGITEAPIERGCYN